MADTIKNAFRAAEGKAPGAPEAIKAQGMIPGGMALEPKGANHVNPLKLTPGTTGIPEAPALTTSPGAAPTGAPATGGAPAGYAPAQMGPVSNPNVAKGARSAEGAEYLKGTQAQAQAQPQAAAGGGGRPPGARPGVIDMANGGSGKGAAFNAGNKVGQFLNNPVVKGAGKVLAVADAAGQAGDALDNFAQGNNVMGGYHAARAGVATAAGMGNPLAIAGSTGLFIGDRIYNNISDNMQNTIGSGVNDLVRGTGKVFGQDWGVGPQQATDYTPPKFLDVSAPGQNQNPLRVQERNARVADPGRQAVVAPIQPKVEATPQSDKIMRYDVPGKSPLFTNMALEDGSNQSLLNRREITPQNEAIMQRMADKSVAETRGMAEGALRREQYAREVAAAQRINDAGAANAKVVEGRMQQEKTDRDLQLMRSGFRGNPEAQIKVADLQTGMIKQRGLDDVARGTSSNQLAGTMYTADQHLAGTQDTADATRYTADANAKGNRLRAQIDGMKFQAEQGWKGLEHNRAVGNDTRQAREHGEKMFNESVSRMFPGEKGAEDAAAFTKAAHHTIANHVNNLRKSGSPEAMAKAQELEANPWSSEMMSRLAQGYQVRKTSAANHGNWGTPGSGKHVESDDLFSYTADPTRKTDKGMFDNEVPLRNGGTISENAASGTSAIKNAFGYGQRTQDQINYINQR